MWSGQSIVAIGRSIDVIDGSSSKGTRISRSLPAKIDGDLSLISRLDADNLWFVNRYNATFAVVSEKGALQSDPAGLLDSPELRSLAVIPTGYQVSQGIPMNLFDKQGHLRSRFLLAQPVLTGNKVFAPQNMAFSDNNHLLIASNSGEVAIYKIP